MERASATAAAASVSSRCFPLLELPEEIFRHMTTLLFEAKLPATLRLRQVCLELRARLEEVRQAAERRRLCWLQEFTLGEIALSNGGRTATKSGPGRPMTMSRDLPTSGISSWWVRVDRSLLGLVEIGVCDAQRRHAWGLYLYSGMLGRLAIEGSFSARPPGYPDGHAKRVMVDADGEDTDLENKAEGAVITVIYNASAGALAYRVNGGVELAALSGFPSGAAMRPWVRMRGDAGDGVTLSPWV
jgi:hypothetical protein